MNLLLLILNYNRPDLTAHLVDDIRREVHLVRDEGSPLAVEVVVVNALDANSLAFVATPPYQDGAGVDVMHLPNAGFVRNWNLALFRMQMEHDDVFDRTHFIACWNNDLRLRPGFFRTLFEPFADAAVGVVSPRYNTPHPFIQRPGGDVVVPYVEFTAPVFRKEALLTCGTWDEGFAYGWGVDIDYCYKLRQLGRKCVRVGGAELHHLEGGNFTPAARRAYIRKAGADIKRLEQTIGLDWPSRVMSGFPGCRFPKGWRQP